MYFMLINDVKSGIYNIGTGKARSFMDLSMATMRAASHNDNLDKNEVVKFNNDMNTVALRKFNSTEINLLMSICSRVRDQDLKYVEFDFNYLKTLIKIPL